MAKSNTPKQTKPDAAQGANSADSKIVALLVTAKPEGGFRRAGRHWGKEQVRVEVDELSEADIEALFAEPMLDVVGVAE